MRFTKSKREEVVGLVLEQMLEDISNQDTDAIYALLLDCPSQALVAFLPQLSRQYADIG